MGSFKRIFTTLDCDFIMIKFWIKIIIPKFEYDFR